MAPSKNSESFLRTSDIILTPNHVKNFIQRSKTDQLDLSVLSRFQFLAVLKKMLVCLEFGSS